MRSKVTEYLISRNAAPVAPRTYDSFAEAVAALCEVQHWVTPVEVGSARLRKMLGTPALGYSISYSVGTTWKTVGYIHAWFATNINAGYQIVYTYTLD